MLANDNIMKQSVIVLTASKSTQINLALAILKKVGAEWLGLPRKFQVNIKTQLNAARVSRPSFHSYDYGFI